MITFLKGLLLASASIALIALAYLALATVRTENAIATSAAAVPGIVDSRLGSLQGDILKLVDGHAKTLEASVNGAVRTVDKRLASIQDDAKGQLGQLNQTVALTAKALPPALGELNHSIAGVSADVHQVAVPLAGTAVQLNDAAPLYLDCEFNPDCAFNRFQGVSKATEQTLQAVAKAAPKIAESTVRIEQDIQREADELTRPKKWWQRVLDYVKLGGAVAARVI